MGSKIEHLVKKELITKGQIPTWLKKATQYEVIMGSVAHGVSSDTSDLDIFGFCVPPKDQIYPHTAGKLHGYDEMKLFEQWHLHHIKDPEHKAGKTDEYDCTIFSILNYFKLLNKGDTNCIGSLFSPSDCILYTTPLAGVVRSERQTFLHKGCYHKFRGYLHAQMSKLTRVPTGKRAATVAKFGFDVKYAAHAVRLADECEQILELGDLDIRRSREHQKAIRRGEVPLNDIKAWVMEKERSMSRLYETSKLRHKPDSLRVKQILIDCLEMHFGSISDAEMINPDRSTNIVNKIRELLETN